MALIEHKQPLHELCSAIVDCPHFTPLWTDQGSVVLRNENIRRGKLDLSNPSFTNEENFIARTQRALPTARDLVITREAPMGEVCMIPDGLRCCLGQRMVLLRPNESKVDPLYLLYALQSESVQNEIRIQGGTGSTVSNLRIPALAALQIPVPPTQPEQRRIASALGDADALIDSLEQLLTKKRQIKRAAMQELLTGKRRLPGFEARWQDLPIKALAEIQRGASPRPIDDPVWFDDSSSVGWVRISDVTQSGMYLRATAQRLSQAGIRKSRFVPAGNLIMSICATVGRPIITELDTCIHDGFVVFDALTVDQKFLYYALLNIEDEWSKHGQTGSQMNLNTGLINRTEIPVPDEIEEQIAIAEVLADIDADVSTLESRLTKARALKQAMAQALLTGRIRLVEPTA